MEKPIIEVKNVGKKYSITHVRGGYIALRDVISGIVKSPFSFIKHKTKQAVGLEKKEEFWALKDVSFNVARGEVVGIIGANGAGKSTLLKILSQITPPTLGEIIIRGRVGSLLEVGTGFHPELTGRENIFLNGAILGMARQEIAKKFDQIVEFAGIEKFLDTPVKFYSSGMYVRLAFSVAAHMEPDILLIDEVLSVGDAEFQKKCLGKMEEITKKEGRTILFISHNMGAIAELCSRSILIEHGNIKLSGPTSKVIAAYSSSFMGNSPIEIEPSRNKNGSIQQAQTVGENNESKDTFDIAEPIHINIQYEVKESLPQMQLSVIISTNNIVSVVQAYDTDNNNKLETVEPGIYKAVCTLPRMFLKAGSYKIRITIGTPKMLIHDTGYVLGFMVQELSMNTQHKSYKMEREGLVISPAIWQKNKIT